MQSVNPTFYLTTQEVNNNKIQNKEKELENNFNTLFYLLKIMVNKIQITENDLKKLKKSIDQVFLNNIKSQQKKENIIKVEIMDKLKKLYDINVNLLEDFEIRGERRIDPNIKQHFLSLIYDLINIVEQPLLVKDLYIENNHNKAQKQTRKALIYKTLSTFNPILQTQRSR